MYLWCQAVYSLMSLTYGKWCTPRKHIDWLILSIIQGRSVFEWRKAAFVGRGMEESLCKCFCHFGEDFCHFWLTSIRQKLYLTRSTSNLLCWLRNSSWEDVCCCRWVFAPINHRQVRRMNPITCTTFISIDRCVISFQSVLVKLRMFIRSTYFQVARNYTRCTGVYSQPNLSWV